MKRIIAFCILSALCLTCLCSCDIGNGLIAELFGKYGVEELPIEPSPMPVETIPNYGLEDVVPDYSVEETWTEIATEPPVEYPTDDDDIVGTETGMVPPDCIEPVVELVMDGDLSDWLWVEWWKQDFDASNLDALLGEVGNGGFTMYVGCDTRFVYLAFDVRDTTLAYSETDTYNGDALQLHIDYNGWVAYAEGFERGIAYSFGLQKDGSVNMTVQCIQDDAVSTVDYVMSSKDGDLKGVTVAKADGSGWIAELAIPWKTLYDDVSAKLAPTGAELPAFDDLAYSETLLNMLVCYLDHAESGEVKGAWGTSNAPLTAEGWYPENYGLNLTFNPLWPAVHGQYR